MDAAEARDSLAKTREQLIGASALLASIKAAMSDAGGNAFEEMEPAPGAWERWWLASGASSLSEEVLRLSAMVEKLASEPVSLLAEQWRANQVGEAEEEGVRSNGVN